MKIFKVMAIVGCTAMMTSALLPVVKADDFNTKTAVNFKGSAGIPGVYRTGRSVEISNPNETLMASQLPAAETTPPLLGLFALLTIAGALAQFAAGKRFHRSSLAANFIGFLLYTSLFLFIAPSGLRAQSTRAPVNLGTAGNYVILSETGITDVSPSPVTGNIGASPITGAAIHVTCAEMKGSGTISSVDAAGPACAVINPVGLGVAIGDMSTAYADAAGRTIPDFTELYAGNISGKTLVPGLYKWSTDVSMDSTGVTSRVAQTPYGYSRLQEIFCLPAMRISTWRAAHRRITSSGRPGALLQ